MTQPVLVINAGSSSLKYQLVDVADGSVLAKGAVERIGEEGSSLRHEVDGRTYDAVQPVASIGVSLVM